MARDPTKLAGTDGRTFALLADGPLTSRRAGVLLGLAENTAFRSLQRLVLRGLATAAPGERNGMSRGATPWTWTLVPGSIYPGPAPRKKHVKQLKGMASDDAPPVRIRRAGNVPADVARSVGLAGLVQQMVGKT